MCHNTPHFEVNHWPHSRPELWLPEWKSTHPPSNNYCLANLSTFIRYLIAHCWYCIFRHVFSRQGKANRHLHILTSSGAVGVLHALAWDWSGVEAAFVVLYALCFCFVFCSAAPGAWPYVDSSLWILFHMTLSQHSIQSFISKYWLKGHHVVLENRFKTQNCNLYDINEADQKIFQFNGLKGVRVRPI